MRDRGAGTVGKDALPRPPPWHATPILGTFHLQHPVPHLTRSCPHNRAHVAPAQTALTLHTQHSVNTPTHLHPNPPRRPRSKQQPLPPLQPPQQRPRAGPPPPQKLPAPRRLPRSCSRSSCSSCRSHLYKTRFGHSARSSPPRSRRRRPPPPRHRCRRRARHRAAPRSVSRICYLVSWRHPRGASQQTMTTLSQRPSHGWRRRHPCHSRRRHRSVPRAPSCAPPSLPRPTWGVGLQRQQRYWRAVHEGR